MENVYKEMLDKVGETPKYLETLYGKPVGESEVLAVELAIKVFEANGVETKELKIKEFANFGKDAKNKVFSYTTQDGKVKTVDGVSLDMFLISDFEEIKTEIDAFNGLKKQTAEDLNKVFDFVEDKINEALKKNGLPSVSLTQWEKGLLTYDIRAVYEAPERSSLGNNTEA